MVPPECAGKPGTVDCPNPKCGQSYCVRCGLEIAGKKAHFCLDYQAVEKWESTKVKSKVKRCPQCAMVRQELGLGLGLGVGLGLGLGLGVGLG